MPQDENRNLDSWRINRNKARREDDILIDTLCDSILQLQNKILELEAALRHATENTKG